MNTHIERLPEYYPARDEDLAFEDWLKKFLPVNRLPQDWDKEVVQKMATKRILVIDDEIKIREMYRHIFCSMGYVVVAAGNALDARDLLLRHKYDIVLLDINMPEINGPILFELIRTFHRDVKVVVSSVYSINEQKNRIKEADGYFDKSDDKDILVSIVSSLLN